MRRWLLLLVLACGCADQPPPDPEAICAVFASCATPATPSAEVAECVAALPLPSEACMECVDEHESSCDLLQTDCLSLCTGDQGGTN